MKIIKPDQLGAAGVESNSAQPDPRQAHKGTVVHWRWDGARAAAIAGDGFFDIDVQREADDVDQAANFAVVVTLEMAGEANVYTQVLSRIALKPRVIVAA
jgi:plastocyanin